MTEGDERRLDELLIAKATDGLDPAESAELEWRLAHARDADPDTFDEAAAWYWLGAADIDAAMPDDVAARCRTALAGEVAAPTRRAGEVPRHRRQGRRWAAYAPWVAAAAALILAVAGWWPRLAPRSGESLAQARERLIETAPDTVRVEWRNTEHPRGQALEGGFVVWSDARQEGYMTFRGIPANDPSRHQYQLWVFDRGRTDQYPVNGGVFDADGGAGGQLIVPIENALPVEHAEMFAVTLEPPGGVVVSDRDPILWIAKPGASDS